MSNTLSKHRVRFVPNFYHRDSSSSAEEAPNASPEGPSKKLSRGLFGKSRKSAGQVEKNKLQQNKAKKQLLNGQAPTESDSSSSLEAEALGDQIPGGTDVLEVWFTGCHTGTPPPPPPPLPYPI